MGIFVSFFGFSVIALKADVRKLGAAHQTRLDVGHAHRGAVQVGTKIEAKLTDKGFGRPIDVSAGVRPAACRRADIDDMAAIALNHPRQHGAGHVHQPFIIGVDHIFPVFHTGAVRRLQTKRQAGVVHQHIDSLPLGGQVSNQRLNGGAVADVKLRDIKVIAQLVFQRLQALFTTTGGNHFMTVSDKTASNTFTKTGGGAGDHDNHLTVPQRFLCFHTIARTGGDR